MKKGILTSLTVIALAMAGCSQQTDSSVFDEFELKSRSTGTERSVGVYLPAGYTSSQTYPVIYMEDGLVFKEGNYQHLLDSLIDNSIIKPVVVACSYEDKNRIEGFELAVRNAEYVETVAASDPALQTIFDNHLKYFTDEFIPAIEDKYSVSTERADRIYYGTSNSADFGLTLSLLRPELFHEYWCFSPVFSDMSSHGMIAESTSYRICWGVKEETKMSFDYFPALAQSLRKRGGSVRTWTFDAGHDRPAWELEFVKLLSEQFRAQ